jgi:hypothetical protein
MITLPDVTLIALTGRNVEAHERALEYSCHGIKFGDAKVVYDENIKSIDDWNYEVVYNLGKYVYTDYALLFHSDGFVVNPSSWNPDWLNYDYIGAPWPLPTDNYSYRDVHGEIQRVGNSVGLRSKKLLDLPRKLDLSWKPYYGNTNEDGFISVHNRHIFEEHGCKFAPLEVAAKFSRETPLPENAGVKPFMFHRYQGENSSYPRFK